MFPDLKVEVEWLDTREEESELHQNSYNHYYFVHWGLGKEHGGFPICVIRYESGEKELFTDYEDWYWSYELVKADLDEAIGRFEESMEVWEGSASNIDSVRALDECIMERAKAEIGL